MAETLTVWITAGVPQKQFDELRAALPACEFLTAPELDAEALARVDVLYAEDPIPDEMMARMPRLEWVQVTRGGVYEFLTPFVKASPLQITSSTGVHGPAFSDFCIALLFALGKKLPHFWRAQHEGRWDPVTPGVISGKTLGILGLGTTGSELARKANCLGLRVLATKRTPSPKPDYVDHLGLPDYMPQLLAESDFVVLAMPSIPSTVGLLGERELRLMKPTAYLINLTTGKAITEELLVRALKEGWIAGAAIDALPLRPLPMESELWKLPNLIITPRVAGQTPHKWELIVPIFQDNLQRFIDGRPLHNLANKDLGY